MTINSVQAYKGKVIVKDIEKGQKVSKGGLILGNDDGKSEGIRARWAQVYSIGDDIRDIEVGQWILIKHGRWTRGIDIHDETLFMVDYPNGVLAASNDHNKPDLVFAAQESTVSTYQYSAQDFKDVEKMNGISF